MNRHRASRQKGTRGELEAAKTLQHLLTDDTIARVLDQPREGGGDLDGVSLRHFHVEVKRVEAPRLKPWLDKAQAHSERIPVVMWRQNGTKEWSYYLRLDAFHFSDFVRIFNCLMDGHHP